MLRLATRKPATRLLAAQKSATRQLDVQNLATRILATRKRVIQRLATRNREMIAIHLSIPRLTALLLYHILQRLTTLMVMLLVLYKTATLLLTLNDMLVMLSSLLLLLPTTKPTLLLNPPSHTITAGTPLHDSIMQSNHKSSLLLKVATTLLDHTHSGNSILQKSYFTALKRGECFRLSAPSMGRY